MKRDMVLTGIVAIVMVAIVIITAIKAVILFS